jgi:hypothetical protein
MSPSSRAAISLVGLAFAGDAYASACCTGNTTTTPARLGRCEHAAVAITATGETSIARWDGEGAVQAPSPDEKALLGTLAGGIRWKRWGQVGLVLPMRETWRSVDAKSDSGGGLGDLSVIGLVEPIEESAGDHRPVPVLSVGLRAPTGRDWSEARGPLLADVTGLPGGAVLSEVFLERTLGKTPWAGGIDVVVPFGAEEQPVTAGAWASAGRYVGNEWSLNATVRHQRGFAERAAAKTTLGARVVRGERLLWRAWGGFSVDLPVPMLGEDSPAAASVTAGLAIVR